jgi:outer membrane protein assembly factor BamB/tetratricopeptide (TPR) repeat protein
MVIAMVVGLGLCLAQPASAPPTAPSTRPAAGTQPATGPASSTRPATRPAGVLGRGARGADANSSGRAKPLPLVNTDEDLAGYLNQARDCIDGNEPLRAIEILQRVIDRPEASLIADPEGRRFVSLASKASELIGTMDAEGLALYRSIYDPQAQRLYEEALAAGDAFALRRIAFRYLHSSYGARALNMLGAMAFDTGSFAQASRYWKQAALLRSPELSEALLLAKVGAAQHLAGEESRSKETLAALREKFPSASAPVGGRERALDEFLQDVSKMPVVFQGSSGPRGEGWAGVGSQGDGMGVMTEVDVVLSPRWYDPPQTSRGTVRLTASADFSRMQVAANMRMNFSLKEGHVEGQIVNNANYGGYDGSMPRKMVMPPIIHPVVAGDVVIYRTDGNVTAVDLVTGELRWHSVDLPMERVAKNPDRNGYYNPYGMQIEDTGRYTLTVADGKVFAVANFKPPSSPNEGIMAARNGTPREADSSELVAISVARQGSQIWRVGNGKGATGADPNYDVLNQGRFLCAPTYDAGRLYVVSVYLENYYLLCLNADTGGLIWKQMVCQVPVVTNDYNPYMSLVHKAFPPAVSDGRVFVATNAGVVASLDAETGQSVWAFQYDSPFNQVLATRTGGYRPPTIGRSYPPNPVLVSGGKVVILPADSEHLLALSAEDGAVLWDVDRAGMRDLSAIDAGRACLSGPGVAVVSMVDGGRLADVSTGENIMGRPAVTPAAVYASGRGKLVRLDLADYKSSSRPLAGIEDNLGLLGNLVAVREELVAANAMGICSYMNYDQALARLTQRMELADAKGRCDLLLTRGRFSFSAKHFPQALRDLLAAREQAGQLGLTDVQARARPWLHRAYVAMGNVSEDPNVSLDMYEQAMKVAESNQEIGHMRLRLAKFHRARGAADDEQASLCRKAGDSLGATEWGRKKIDELSKAVALAQELAEQQGDEELADLSIGKDADDSILLDGRAEFVVGRRLARDLIGGVIRAYGREPYAAQDALAKAALDDARQKGDEQLLARVGQRWPDSVWADASILMAAEGLYRKSAEEKKDAAEEKSAQVRKWLAPLAMESGDPTIRISACIGMAAVYARGGWVGAADTNMQKARELATEVSGGAGGGLEVSFADLHGKLDDVLKQIGDGKFTRTLRPAQDVSSITMPLVPALSFRDENWSILRDQDNRPIRMGEKVLMLQGNRAVMVSTVANDPNQAVDWQALTSVDQALLRQYSAMPTTMKLVAGLSRDEKVVAVCDRASIRGFAVQTAKALWSQTMDRLDMSGGPYAMAIGDGYAVLVNSGGDVACLDVGTGQLLWKGVSLSGQPNQPQSKCPSTPPQIVGGKILICHNYGRSLTCLDAADNGRVIGKWDGASGNVTGAFSPNGNLAVMVDGTLSLYDAGQLGGAPLWTRKYEVNGQPTLLAAGNDFIAVMPGMNRPVTVVEVLASGGGDQPVASVTLPDVGNQRVYPVSATIEGTNLLVTASPNFVGQRSQLQQALPLSGLSLHRIDLAKKRRIWSYEVEPAGQQFNSMLTPPVIGTNYVAMLSRGAQGGDASVHVIDMETGKRAGKIDLMGRGGAFGQPQAMRLQAIGPPVMTNGRLCVETMEGVVIYGGQ